MDSLQQVVYRIQTESKAQTARQKNWEDIKTQELAKSQGQNQASHLVKNKYENEQHKNP